MIRFSEVYSFSLWHRLVSRKTSAAGGKKKSAV
jgi:hypothetical protein